MHLHQKGRPERDNYVSFDVAPFQYENWAAYQQGVQKLFLDPARSLKITASSFTGWEPCGVKLQS